MHWLRRLFEEKNPEQGWNGLKYFLTIVAVCLRTAYSIQKGQIAWRVLAAISSAAAAIFSTYWDFIHDWGLLNRTSKNRWLRDKLLIPQKKVYFIAMVSLKTNKKKIDSIKTRFTATDVWHMYLRF